MRTRMFMAALAAITILGLAPGLAPISQAEAAEAPPPPAQDWSFTGAFGTYDRAELQRGLQVYQEVCSSCHALDYIAFRNLADLGYNEAEVKAIAAEYEVEDGPNSEGDMFTRLARPADIFPAPFANDQAARASNNGALPPDLSLIAEARADGSNYLYAMLTGYGEPPADVAVADGMSWNGYFPGGQIAMPPPLVTDGVEYSDGTAATVEQQARDVTAFLTWASEPNMEARKHMGVMALMFLLVLTGLLYVSKRRIWAGVH